MKAQVFLGIATASETSPGYFTTTITEVSVKGSIEARTIKQMYMEVSYRFRFVPSKELQSLLPSVLYIRYKGNRYAVSSYELNTAGSKDALILASSPFPITGQNNPVEHSIDKPTKDNLYDYLRQYCSIVYMAKPEFESLLEYPNITVNLSSMRTDYGSNAKYATSYSYELALTDKSVNSSIFDALNSDNNITYKNKTPLTTNKSLTSYKFEIKVF